MFDAQTISKVIGEPAYFEIQASNLPKIEVMTWLQILTSSSPKQLKARAEAGELMPMLKGQYPALDQARDIRVDNPHLTQTECLQMAGLPLKL